MKNVYFKFERVHLLSLIYMSYRKSPTLVPSKLCLCLPTEWPLLPFLSEEHCRIADSLHITRFCELSSDLDLHRIQFLESHYTNDRSFTGRRGVWLCVCKTVAPPPHTMFFFPEGFRVKIFIFFLVCVWSKWNWKWCLVMLPVSWIFSKRESLKFTVHLVKLLWDFGLGRSNVVYNCLMEPDWEIAGGLLLDLSSGLESFWVSPKYHTTPSLKLEASQSLKCDGSLTLRSSQTSKPMKLSFLGYRKKNCCNSGCKFFWLSLTYCRLEKLLDSSSSSSLSRSILCLFSGISCVFATCVAVYNYKTTMFQSKRKKKSIIENEWIVAEAKETFKEVL